MLSDKKVGNKNILIAISKANKTLSNPNFYKDIAKNSFDQTDKSGAYIASRLKTFYTIFNVSVNQYQSTYFNRNVNAYVINGDHLNMYINTYYARSWEAIYETIIHELIHLVDIYDKDASYGHGDNDPTGDESAAPNKIGRIALKHIGVVDTDKPVTVRRNSLWYYLNPFNWF